MMTVSLSSRTRPHIFIAVSHLILAAAFATQQLLIQGTNSRGRALNPGDYSCSLATAACFTDFISFSKSFSIVDRHAALSPLEVRSLHQFGYGQIESVRNLSKR